nr:TMV resistance protein N-like [Tanacetum cinerariifolium]
MILVTSRDRQLLKASHVEEIYDVALLNDDEALELFSMYAFKKKHPNDEFIEQVNKILHYANGLPLALKTFGSRIQMHNLVQEMGRKIVHEESEEPGKQSRLWAPTDVLDVLKNDKGTDIVKGLALDLSCSEVNICGQSFVKLKNLRLLKLYIGGLSNFRETKCEVSTPSGKL